MTFRNRRKWIKTDEDVLQIRWNERNHYIDLIRGDEFDSECENLLSSHTLCLPDESERYNAKFLKTVRGNTAILDYGSNRVIEENRKGDLYIGVMKIIFTDSDRSVVKEVLWIDKDGEEHVNVSRTSWDLLPDLDDEFVLPEDDDVPREMTSRKERRLQTRFRDTLLQVYGNTCCISQCSIPETFEAAHIVPSSTQKSFDPRNDLLLRADLHRLFDKNMIGIDPYSRTVRLNKALTNSQEYCYLADVRIREAKPKSYRPIDAALQKRWRYFELTVQID